MGQANQYYRFLIVPQFPTDFQQGLNFYQRVLSSYQKLISWKTFLIGFQVKIQLIGLKPFSSPKEFIP